MEKDLSILKKSFIIDWWPTDCYAHGSYDYEHYYVKWFDAKSKKIRETDYCDGPCGNLPFDRVNMFRTSKEKHWRAFKAKMKLLRVYNFVMVNESEFNEATHIGSHVFKSHGHVTVFKKAHMYCYHIETMTLSEYNDYLASKMDDDLIENTLDTMFKNIFGEFPHGIIKGIDIYKGSELINSSDSEKVPDENEEDELVKWQIDQWAKTGELR